MVNTQSCGALARSRPRATGLVASALLLVISVDYAMAGTVPPTSDREDVSGTLTRNDGDADDESLTINVIDATDADPDGPGQLAFAAAIFGGRFAVTENDGFVSAVVGRLGVGVALSGTGT